MKTMMCLLPMASMKPHLLEDQLAWALQLDVVVHLVVVHQLLQPEQGISSFLSCFDVLLHHVGSVLHDECVVVHLVLHTWMSKHQHVLALSLQHQHVLVQLFQMKRNHDQNLKLQKNNELVEFVDSVWQELMWSEVEHSSTCLFHLLAFLLFHHHPCLSCLSFLFLFLFLSSGSIHTHPCSTDHHRPNSLHSRFDHRPNSRHSFHSIHLLAIHLHNLLHSPCEHGLFFFLFLGLFLFLI